MVGGLKYSFFVEPILLIDLLTYVTYSPFFLPPPLSPPYEQVVRHKIESYLPKWSEISEVDWVTMSTVHLAPIHRALKMEFDIQVGR